MIRTTRYGDVVRYDLARTLMGRGRYWTTAYRVGELMVDTGCAHTAGELLDELEGVALHTVVNTHTHEDHIGANGLLQNQLPEIRILAHPLALAVLANPRREQPLHPYRRIFWGWPEPSNAMSLSDGEWVECGRFRFQVIYTPGHSPDHLCLYEPEHGWLFTGDLFVGGRDRALRAGCDIWGIITSLKWVAALPAKTLFPGSARVRENPQQALREKIDYYEALGQQVLALERQGRSLGEIVSALCVGPMWVEFVTLGHFSRRWLVRSYLGRYKEQ